MASSGVPVFSARSGIIKDHEPRDTMIELAQKSHFENGECVISRDTCNY